MKPLKCNQDIVLSVWNREFSHDPDVGLWWLFTLNGNFTKTTSYICSRLGGIYPKRAEYVFGEISTYVVLSP